MNQSPHVTDGEIEANTIGGKKVQNTNGTPVRGSFGVYPPTHSRRNIRTTCPRFFQLTRTFANRSLNLSPFMLSTPCRIHKPIRTFELSTPKIHQVPNISQNFSPAPSVLCQSTINDACAKCLCFDAYRPSCLCERDFEASWHRSPVWLIIWVAV